MRVLDQIRAEAPEQQTSRYRPSEDDVEKVNQARARAFIHLYLKVMFGLTDFTERERTITDGSADAGIDGYFIDAETKTIHIVQSKFRTTKKNFESKEIALDELLAMDITRVLEGESKDESGIEYNGKIKQFQREVSSLPDVARFSYRIVILANLTGVTPSKLKLLTGGYAAEVFDFEKTYQKLVFPVVTGNYFAASDIVIPIDLSNKNSGSKISYNVKTKYSDCEITVLFVPTLQIARIMHKYKNAILKYNPRSYLEFEGKSVHASIRDSIISTSTNEFAIFNNGITMLSEETNINEKIGQKNKAQLRIKNPQIINGGQTSFTLSRIYSENMERAEALFADKEVLLKIITVLDNDSDTAKLQLIDEISTATNKQTPIVNADRFANDAIHLSVQRKMFERYGVLYERKRGEFSDGLRDGYVKSQDIVERNKFWRLFYAANGQISKGFEKRLFQKNDFAAIDLADDTAFDRAFLALGAFRKLRRNDRPETPMSRDMYAKIFMYVELFLPEGWKGKSDADLDADIDRLKSEWNEFIKTQSDALTPKRRAYIDEHGEAKVKILAQTYRPGSSLPIDLRRYILAKREEVA
ncbi:MAG: AIPR family protein [Rhodoferax sp.]